MNDNEQLTPEQAQKEWDRLAAENTGAGSSPAPLENPPPADDIWAGVPEQFRKKLENIDALEHRLSSAEGRVGSLQRDLAAAKAAAADVSHAPTQQQIDAASTDSGKWNELMSDYAEWGEAFEERLSVERNTAMSQLTQINQRLEEQNATLNRRLSEMEVELHHKGWKQTIMEPEFDAWLKTQPKEALELAASESASDAIQLLNRYKGGRNAADEVLASRRSRLEASATPQQRQTGRPANTVDMDGMTDKEFWDFEARQKAAKREQQRSFNRY